MPDRQLRVSCLPLCLGVSCGHHRLLVASHRIAVHVLAWVRGGRGQAVGGHPVPYLTPYLSSPEVKR
jgi:hypothetical protein